MFPGCYGRIGEVAHGWLQPDWVYRDHYQPFSFGVVFLLWNINIEGIKGSKR